MCLSPSLQAVLLEFRSKTWKGTSADIWVACDWSWQSPFEVLTPRGCGWQQGLEGFPRPLPQEFAHFLTRASPSSGEGDPTKGDDSAQQLGSTLRTTRQTIRSANRETVAV
jgi:hypothetical protein